MKNQGISITIIMCAYTLERWSELLRAVTSVQRQTLPPNEIILVIDHNPDLYYRAVAAFPKIRVIENLEERGLSGARNSGIHQAQGEILCFIDEDAIASSNWIENLLHTYSNEGILGVGGEVRPLWTASSPGWFPEEFNWVVGCSYKGLPERVAAIRNPIGCNMTFRKKALLAVGGFRNGMGRVGTMPVGCEETELSIRLRKAYPKASILYQPAAIVYHRVPVWRTTWKYFTHRCFAEGLSKAQVTRFVGSNDGLSSERSYTAVTLPQGLFKGLREGFLKRKIDGFTRAGAITAGLLITTLGYMAGLIQQRTRNLTIRPRDSNTTAVDIESGIPFAVSTPETADLRDIR